MVYGLYQGNITVIMFVHRALTNSVGRQQQDPVKALDSPEAQRDSYSLFQIHHTDRTELSHTPPSPYSLQSHLNPPTDHRITLSNTRSFVFISYQDTERVMRKSCLDCTWSCCQKVLALLTFVWHHMKMEATFLFFIVTYFIDNKKDLVIQMQHLNIF